MLLLVSGASAVGKTTARLHARHLLDDAYETAELFTLGPIPAVPTVAWRQEQVEAAVVRAIALETEGKHLLFAGDPVPLGEALAVPSADRIDIAACLLDVDDEAHLARLTLRNEPADLIPLHQGFAAWLRAHASDPGHVTEAITNDAWSAMQWERWIGRTPGPEWAMTVLDTSRLKPEQGGPRSPTGAGVRWPATPRSSGPAGSASDRSEVAAALHPYAVQGGRHDSSGSGWRWSELSRLDEALNVSMSFSTPMRAMPSVFPRTMSLSPGSIPWSRRA
jgi:hypothetical protein